MLALENLTKSYRIQRGRHYVFKNVSVRFPDGANIGIIGPNGAGKSTFLNILGGVDHPDSGRIVTNYTFSWPLGLKGGFLRHLSGRENSRMVCNLYGLTHDATRRKVELIKEMSGIGDYFEEPVIYYSSGMSGRLAFAISMAFDFDYFLIDEITSVGDAHFRDRARQALEEKAMKSHVIMVSHSFPDLKRFCNVGVLVQNGEVKVFDNLDAAIRAYLPQTAEAELAEQAVEQVSLQDTAIVDVALDAETSRTLAEIKDAIDTLERLLSAPGRTIEEPQAEFYYRYGMCYLSLGDSLHARECIGKAVELDPYHLPSQLRMAWFAVGRGDKQSEDEALKAAETIDRKNPAVLSARIQYWLRAGEYDQALACSDIALRVKPKDAAVWAERARILLNKGDDKAALEAQMKAIRYDPKNLRHYQAIAGLLATAGDFEGAGRARTRALALMNTKAKRSRHPAYKTILKDLQELTELVHV